MKKTLLIIILLFSSLLIMSACQPDILTYDNPGTITITIKNSGINANNVTVSTSNPNADISKSGKIITVEQSKMLRIVITLSVDGYVSESIIVRSTDYSQDRTYSTDVTFEESYISMELTVITDAPSESIELASDNIISYNSQGNVYDIKLSKDGIPEIVVSAGDDYREFIITLNSNEITKGISSRTIMLLDMDYVMVTLMFGNDYYINSYTESTKRTNQYKSGNYTYYSIPNDKDCIFYIYGPSYNYIGEKLITVEDMAEESNFTLSIENLDANIQLTITPYMDNYSSQRWFVLAEKQGDDYLPLIGNYRWGTISDNYTFNLSKDYYVFTMGGDGKIRYKALDFTEVDSQSGYGYKTLSVNFNNTDTIRNITLEIVDYNGDVLDFSGTTLTGNSSEYLGTISSGKTVSINPSMYFDTIYLTDLPNDYVYYNNTSLDNEEHLFSMAINGIYKITVYVLFDLEITIDSEMSYENFVVNTQGETYYVDSNNKVTITNYNINQYCTMHNGYYQYYVDLNYAIGSLYNIIRDGDNYSITIVP